jgi:excisionase family DNA binding protein
LHLSRLPPVTPDSILTVEEAAELLRVNRKTLYETISRERPPWARYFGRTIRISTAALLAAFNAGPARTHYRC